MSKENSVIETGVDKLVELIRAKKRISVQETAKKLGVSPIVVEEWADFLEEEGIISIEYKFATPYLIERKATKEEIKSKEKEFHSEKEGFVRKAEVTLAILDGDEENFQKFKEKFEKLKRDIGSDLGNVESELKQLEKFDNLKGNIDKQIFDQEKKFRKKLDEFEAEINREQKKYEDIINNIDYEEEKLDKEKLETLSLREKEINLKKKLIQFQDIIIEINDAIKKDETVIEDSEKRINELKNRSEKIKKEVSSKKGVGEGLIKESRQHKQNILNLQKAIIDKIEKNKKTISTEIESGKNSTRKFREFFNKKDEIGKLIKKMDQQRDELEQELIELIKKAKVFHLTSGSSGLKGHVKGLEKTFEDVKKKKKKFEQEAIKLSSLLKS